MRAIICHGQGKGFDSRSLGGTHNSIDPSARKERGPQGDKTRQRELFRLSKGLRVIGDEQEAVIFRIFFESGEVRACSRRVRLQLYLG